MIFFPIPCQKIKPALFGKSRDFLISWIFLYFSKEAEDMKSEISKFLGPKLLLLRFYCFCEDWYRWISNFLWSVFSFAYFLYLYKLALFFLTGMFNLGIFSQRDSHSLCLSFGMGRGFPFLKSFAIQIKKVRTFLLDMLKLDMISGSFFTDVHLDMLKGHTQDHKPCSYSSYGKKIK